MIEPDWNEEFHSITKELRMAIVNKDGANINRVIWRLNEASLYLSRYLQYDLCGHAMLLPNEVRECLPHLANISRAVSVAMEQLEHSIDEEIACLECVEEALNAEEEI